MSAGSPGEPSLPPPGPGGCPRSLTPGYVAAAPASAVTGPPPLLPNLPCVSYKDTCRWIAHLDNPGCPFTSGSFVYLYLQKTLLPNRVARPGSEIGSTRTYFLESHHPAHYSQHGPLSLLFSCHFSQKPCLGLTLASCLELGEGGPTPISRFELLWVGTIWLKPFWDWGGKLLRKLSWPHGGISVCPPCTDLRKTALSARRHLFGALCPRRFSHLSRIRLKEHFQPRATLDPRCNRVEEAGSLHVSGEKNRRKNYPKLPFVAIIDNSLGERKVVCHWQ